MKDDFVTYEIAKKLEEKGFNWLPLKYYHGGEKGYLNDVSKNCDNPNKIKGEIHISCPTISQVLKWLRQEKNTHIIIDICKRGWFFNIRCLRTGYVMDGTSLGYSCSFEQASLVGIEFVLDNIIKEE